ncbi:MAG TPA: hypothetical protein VN982_16205 [Candidatus Dormibacteraeota bacterium]|nr:hypothetical protein [Candidatus Dormibacteraeota bacterium]
MATRTIFVSGLRILAVCLLFAVCSAVGGVLSGIDKVAQQSIAAQPNPLANQQVPPMPDNFLSSFLIFTLCVGGILSYLILRARWHGWMLVGAIFVSMYGISTVASQLESVAFLSKKLPHGMIRAIFLQGAIAEALFAPLAVLALGKWRAASIRGPKSPAVPPKLTSILLRLAILVAAFVFLYMFFGYYVAWRNPELQRFYGGPELATFWAALRHNWISSRWIYALAAFRALLYVGCLYPLVRMLHTSRRESALAAALFSACWTTVLLLPNPLMPASVARSHFWETLGFSLVFGALAGWLLCFTPIGTEPNNQIGGFEAVA